MKFIHGETHPDTPEYTAWLGMHSRCKLRSGIFWKRYGGRGIRVCKRWFDYRKFLADMGRKPSPRHSMDRINNDGNYCPSNCRWATPEEQQNNTSKNIVLEWQGQRKSIAQWAVTLGIHVDALYSRKKLGWPTERILGEPRHLERLRLRNRGKK